VNDIDNTEMEMLLKMATIQNEIEIDTLKNEIIETTGCNESSLEGFSVIELELIKEKISQGHHYEVVIGAMRCMAIKIDIENK